MSGSRYRLIPLLLLSLLLLAGQTLSAQWRSMYTPTDLQNDVTGVSFLSPSTGWITTDRWIGFTTDSGRTFTKRSVTIGNVDYNGEGVGLTFGFQPNGVHAFSPDTLVVAGDYGFEPSILYSVDAGQHWKLVYHRYIDISTGTLNNSVYAIDFPGNGDRGVAVQGNEVLLSSDRGRSWVTRVIAKGREMSLLSMPNAAMVFASGPEDLYGSTDGGVNWNPIALPSTGVDGMSALDAQRIWVHNVSGEIYATRNGGGSWTKLTTVVPDGRGIRDLRMVDDSLGYATYGAVMQTRNGGRTWEVMDPAGPIAIMKTNFLNRNQGWAFGPEETLYMTTNGGGTSQPLTAFNIDSSAFCATGVVRLHNLGHADVTYQWYRNGALMSNSFEASYAPTTGNDNILLVASRGGRSSNSSAIVPTKAILPITLSARPQRDSVCADGAILFDFDNTRGDQVYSVYRKDLNYMIPPVQGNNGTLTINAPHYSTEDSAATFYAITIRNTPCGTDTMMLPFRIRQFISSVPVTTISDTVCLQNNFVVRVANSVPGYSYWADDRFSKVPGNGGTILLPVGKDLPRNGQLGFPEPDFHTLYDLTVYIQHDRPSCFDPFATTNVRVVSRTSRAVFDVTGYEGITGVPLTFANGSQHASRYTWSFGQGGSVDTSAQAVPTNFSYATSGDKVIGLKAWTREGCVDSASRAIQVFALAGAPTPVVTCPGVDASGTQDSLRAAKYFVPRDISEDEYGDRVVVGGYTDMKFLYQFYPRDYEGWFARKTDKNGNLIWSLEQNAGDELGTYNQNTHIILEHGVGDSLGYTYLFGHSLNHTSFAPVGQPSQPIATATAFLAKVSPKGKVVWMKPLVVPGYPDYAGGTILRGKGGNMWIITQRFPGYDFKFGNDLLYAGQEGSVGIVMEIDRHGRVLRKMSFPMAYNDMRRFESFSSDSYDHLPPAIFDPKGRIVIQGILEPRFMNGNAVGNAVVNFDMNKVRSAFFFVDTANMVVTDVKPVYYPDAAGPTSMTVDAYTMDGDGNYYASRFGKVAVPHSSLAYNGDTLKPRSFLYKFGPDGSILWTTSLEGFQPKGLYFTSGQVYATGTNYDGSGFANGGMIAYANQSKTTSDVKKITMAVAPGSFSGVGGQGIGSLDIVNGSFDASTGKLNSLGFLGTVLEEENIVMRKGYGDQIWVASTVGSNIRNVLNFTDTTSSYHTYKWAIGGNCNTAYRTRGKFVQAEPLTTGNLCIDTTYQVKWSANGISKIDVSVSMDSGRTYVPLAHAVPVSQDSIGVNLIGAGAVGPVIIRLSDADSPLADTTGLVTIPFVRPTVTITPLTDTFCNIGVINLKAQATAKGDQPYYEWYLNNSMLNNGNGIDFQGWPFKNGDQVRVVLRSNQVCRRVDTVWSAVKIMHVFDSTRVSASLTGTTTVNAGQGTGLHVTVQQGGVTPTIAWQDSTAQHDWSVIPSASSADLTYTPRTTGDKVRGYAISNLPCRKQDTAYTNVLSFTVNLTTGIINVNPDAHGVKLYPNPASTYIVIDSLRALDHWDRYEILDNTGRLVGQPVPVDNRTRIEVPVGNLAKGYYIIRLKSKGNVFVHLKFIRI